MREQDVDIPVVMVIPKKQWGTPLLRGQKLDSYVQEDNEAEKIVVNTTIVKDLSKLSYNGGHINITKA